MVEVQHFLQVINANAEVLKLAVGYLSPATYGRAEDFMTASLSSEALQGLAVDLSEVFTSRLTSRISRCTLRKVLACSQHGTPR